MSSDHNSDAIIHTVMKESQQQKKMSPTKKKKMQPQEYTD